MPTGVPDAGARISLGGKSRQHESTREVPMSETVHEAWFDDNCLSFDGRLVELFGFSDSERKHRGTLPDRWALCVQPCDREGSPCGAPCFGAGCALPSVNELLDWDGYGFGESRPNRDHAEIFTTSGAGAIAVANPSGR